MIDSGPWHVMLTGKQRQLVRRLIREEAKRLGVEPGMEDWEWPKENVGRIRQLKTLMRKMVVRANYRAG